MANKRIQDLPAKGATIAANDILELSEYQSPGVYISKKILGSELGGVTTFTALTDTPASYTGQTLKFVRVNAGETALEFATVSVSDTNIANTNLTLPTGTRKLIFGGPNSTDILAFRNSTDTVDLFKVQGDGGWIFRNNDASTYYYFNGTNVWEKSTSFGVYKITTVLGLGATHSYSGVTTIRTSMANTAHILYNQGNFQIEPDVNAILQTSGSGGLSLKNGTAPSIGTADRFTMFAKDIVAGNSAPHFKLEGGDEIKLYKQASAGITTVGDLVTVLTNLGLLG